MTRALVVLCLAFVALRAGADPQSAGWSFTLACPFVGGKGSGSFSSASGGFTGSGACLRYPTHYTKLTFSTLAGGTLNPGLTGGDAYALHTGDVLILPPIQSTETMPVFTVVPGCPAGSLSLNYIFVQFDAAGQQLTNTYLLGTATYSPVTGLVVTSQYDIDGTPYFTGARPMQGSCSAGHIGVVTPGNLDLSGDVTFNANGGGVFKTLGGKATFFFPTYAITSAELGSKTYAGITFNSANAAATRPVRATSNAAGTVFTVNPYSDPGAGTIDVSGTAFTETLTLTPANGISPGFLLGTVTRTGYLPGSGQLACIAMDDSGTKKLICSGQSPNDNLKPYNLTLNHAPLFATSISTPSTSYDAGNVLAGGSPVTYTIYVSNDGEVAGANFNFTLSGDGNFTRTGGTCPANGSPLPALVDCTIIVTYATPLGSDGAGAKQATFSMTFTGQGASYDGTVEATLLVPVLGNKELLHLAPAQVTSATPNTVDNTFFTGKLLWSLPAIGTGNTAAQVFPMY